jgi:hypothetical protein
MKIHSAACIECAANKMIGVSGMLLIMRSLVQKNPDKRRRQIAYRGRKAA